MTDPTRSDTEWHARIEEYVRYAREHAGKRRGTVNAIHWLATAILELARVVRVREPS